MRARWDGGTVSSDAHLPLQFYRRFIYRLFTFRLLTYRLTL
jgi:hypothetical protein